MATRVLDGIALNPKAPTKSQKLHGPRSIRATYLWQRDIPMAIQYILRGEEQIKKNQKKKKTAQSKRICIWPSVIFGWLAWPGPFWPGQKTENQLRHRRTQ